MDNGGLRDLIFQVISSWQVIVATVVVVIFLFLVNYVSQTHYSRSPRPKPVKVKAKDKTADTEEVTDDSELGLEE